MAVTAGAFDDGGVMWLGPTRAFYAGVLGRPARRIVGAFCVYASPQGRFDITLPTERFARRQLAVMPPYVPHTIVQDDPLAPVAAYLIEPDSVDSDALPRALRGTPPGPTDKEILRRLCGTRTQLQLEGRQSAVRESDFDELILGRRLPEKPLDPRIATIVARLRANPAGHISAEECAEAVHLSFSRMLHLFKQEVGVSFRQLRAWRRARQFLCHFDTGTSLTDLAIELGYPDATHFSHSIRHIYGLTPTDVCAAMHGADVVVPPAQRPLDAWPAHRVNTQANELQAGGCADARR